MEQERKSVEEERNKWGKTNAERASPFGEERKSLQKELPSEKKEVNSEGQVKRLEEEKRLEE